MVLRTARLLLALLFALAGLFGVTGAAAQLNAINDIASRIEPLSADTASVYRALADADAAVISGFVGGGDPTALRARVDDDLAVASGGLVRAAARAEDQPTTDAITALGRKLPEYAGLVELSRTNDPAAAETALRRASDLMQNDILPMAETLLQHQTDSLDRAYVGSRALSWALLVVVVGLTVVMIVAQAWMAHRFRRGLNVGMVIATAAVLGGVLWWTVAAIFSGGHVAALQRHGQAVSDALVPAQIAALQARTAEGLALMERDSDPQEQVFLDRLRRLGPDGTDGALGTAARLTTDPTAQAQLRDAITAAGSYRDAHARVHQAATAGRLTEAAQLSLTAQPGTAAAAFSRLDTGLTGAVDAERRSFADQAAQARVWSLSSVSVVLVLTLIGVTGIVLGIGTRLREYP